MENIRTWALNILEEGKRSHSSGIIERWEERVRARGWIRRSREYMIDGNAKRRVDVVLGAATHGMKSPVSQDGAGIGSR